MKTLLTLIFLFLSLGLVVAQTAVQSTSFEKKTFQMGTDQMPYAILLPDDYDASKSYPLLLFLHGAGERGADNESQLTHGAYLFTTKAFRKKFPAIVLMPQCAVYYYWSNVKKEVPQGGMPNFSFYKKGAPTKAMILLEGLLDEVIQNYSLDKNRLYVGGLSMGGMGTFELIKRNPRLFAAAFPICGGAAPKTLRKYKRPSWWVFHGNADPVVPASFSTQMVKKFKKRGFDVRYTLYEGVGHNSWDLAFKEPGLFPWLFSNTK
jgi:predicted peptidase